MSNALDFEVVEVTPEMATEWLKKNLNNRNTRGRVVSQYAADMLAGRWRLNGDAIRFNGNGELLDGQHRLLACVEAGCSFMTVIIKGLSSAEKVTFDAGIKRKFSDILKWRGERNPNQLAASLRAAWTYETYPNPAGLTTPPSHQQLLEFLNANPDIRASVDVGLHVRRILKVPPTSISLVHLYGHRVAAEDAADFFEKLSVGAGIQEGSPILALRRYLELRALERVKPKTEYFTALVIKAFNLYRSGEEVELLRWRAGGAAAETYPRVVGGPMPDVRPA